MDKIDQVFARFAKEINFTITDGFMFVKLVHAQLDQKTNIFDLKFQSLTNIPFPEMREFLNCTNKNFRYKAKIEFVVTSVIFEPQNVRAYLAWALNDYLKEKQLALQVIQNHLEIFAPTVIVEINAENISRRLNEVSPQLTRIMHRFGFDKFELKTRVVEAGELLSSAKSQVIAQGQARLEAESNGNQTDRVVQQRVARGYVNVSIDALRDSHETRVVTEGEIFNVNHRPTRTELVITELSLTNYQDAITVKLFGRDEAEVNKNKQFQIGDLIEVAGDFQIDTYSKEAVIIARKIIVKPNTKQERVDNAPTTRIEFSARTRMSTMDGLVNAQDLVKRVATWNHDAVAIVDDASVQAFPEFYAALKKAKIKGIYGATFNTTPRAMNAIMNPLPRQNLANNTYIVFDLETTGLSPIYNEIIEFGAMKVVNQQIVDNMRFFIKPTNPVPAEITRLTGITNEQVQDGINEVAGLKKLMTFIGNHAVVAHNANFDVSFINEKLAKNDLPLLTNPVIDTLICGRIVHPSAARFRLENLAVRYGITYDSTVAHRADYDADVLARVWVKMVVDLQNLNVTTQSALADYFDERVITKAFKYEVALLAANQKGLKELFKAISNAHTKTYYGEPMLFWESLAERRDLLLGSGTLRSRLVDRMFFGTRKQVAAEIAHYDYIEVQPPRNFVHLFNRGLTAENVNDALAFVIAEAKRQNKIVIASGDVRYLDEPDKIYHEIYINAKGLGGSRHYLYSSSAQAKIPTQNLLTTQEMVEAFAFLEDPALIEEVVVTNPRKLAAKISHIDVIKPGLHTPRVANVDQKLEDVVYRNARAKYGNELPEIIQKRLEKELEPIKKYGFAVIYWIAHLLVSKSLKEGYLVGSRGSVGSSLVATLANITEVNPLSPHYVCPKCKKSIFVEGTLNSGYDLPSQNCPSCQTPLRKEGQNIPFETFLGFNADKTPDIDLNFSGDYQPIVHDEVRRMFGTTHTFRAGTISTVAERTAYGYVLSWAEDREVKLSRAFTDFLTRGVVGTKRTTGQHPGGIIVIPEEFDVEDFTPINFPADDPEAGWKTTHFDFVALHDNLLKLDLLGHDDPTAIKMLERITGIDAKSDIPFTDEKVVSLFSSTTALKIKPDDINGEVVGVMGIPEFGTKLVRLMLRKAQVKSFGDLIAVSGLSHGTGVWTTNAEILVRQGKTLNEVISCRDDIMTDLIAKGLAPLQAFEIMEQVRKGRSINPEQEASLKKHEVADWYIESLKKIRYMFPKAHATAYVMMAWRVAWFKVYYPLAFYAVYLTTRADVFELETVLNGKAAVIKRLNALEQNRNKNDVNKLTTKEQELIYILEIVNEAFARGIEIAGIDLEKSAAQEWVVDEANHRLYPPFIAIDGLGVTVAHSIIKARQNAKFASQDDFKKRTSINNTQFEKLMLLGTFKHLSASNQISFELF